MSSECELGHCWEVYSGNSLNCMFCPAEAEARITYEPSDDEEEEGLEDEEEDCGPCNCGCQDD